MAIIELKKGEADYPLSQHFDTSEFRCKCGCETLQLDTRVVDALEKIRAENGHIPLRINSGYRCPEHNKAIKGSAKNSGHTRGVAADIRTPPNCTTRYFAYVVWAIRKAAGIERLGCYDGYQHKYGFIHIEVDNSLFRASRWGDEFPIIKK